MFGLLVRRLSGKAKPPPKANVLIKPSPTPRPPKDPPDTCYDPEEVAHCEIDVDDFVRPAAYRQFEDPSEKLGPGAGKTGPYRNTHYFGHHRFSFVELQSQAISLREVRRATGGAQCTTQEDMADDDDEPGDDCLEAMKERDKENDCKLAKQAKEEELSKLADWCKEMEKKQGEGKDAPCGNENVPKAIESEVNKILSECAGKLKKAVDLVKTVEDEKFKLSDMFDKPDKPDCDK